MKEIKWREFLERGDLVYVKLEERKKCSIQSGLRPCVVVSNNVNNYKSKSVNVCPLTSKGNKKNIPVHVRLRKNTHSIYLNKTSYILIEQITTVDKNQIISLVGHLDEDSETIDCVNRAIIRQLGLKNIVTDLAYRESENCQEKVI